MLVWLVLQLFAGDETAAKLAIGVLSGFFAYKLPRPAQAGA
jgi:hypothetical protein